MRANLRISAWVMLAALLLGVQPGARACDRREPTQETSPGPHDFSSAPAESKLWQEGDGGEPLFLRMRVLDTCGRPVAGALVRVLHANQYGEHERDRWRAHLRTDAGGELKLLTVSPGYTGGIARHIHFVISHPDHRELVTRLFFKNDPTREQAIEELALVLEEVQRGEQKGWIAGYEFVLAPR